jgi:hypothetical protein
MRPVLFACVLLLAACKVIPSPGPSPVPTSIVTASPTSAPSAVPSPTASPTAPSSPTPAPSLSPSPAPTATPPPGLALPLFAEIGNHTGPLDSPSVAYVARTYSVVALDAFGKPGGHPYQWVEDGQQAQANAIRASAQLQGVPAPVLLGYIGFEVTNHQKDYRAFQGVPANCSITLPGASKPRLDITQSACASWWVSAVSNMVAQTGLDGVFIDGVEDSIRQNGTQWGAAKATMFAMLRSAFDALPDYRSIFGNGEPGNMVASGLNPSFDGTMSEVVDLATCGTDLKQPPTYKTPAENAAMLQAGYAYALSGKIWVAKTWPTPGSFICPLQPVNLQAGAAWAASLAMVANVPWHVMLAYSSGYDWPGWVSESNGVVAGPTFPAAPGLPVGPMVVPSGIPSAYPSPSAPCVISRAYSSGSVSVDLCGRAPSIVSN